MFSQIFVLGLFLLGLQAQIIDFSVGSLGSLGPLGTSQPNPFKSIWPFLPQFDTDFYQPQPWWKGPNVCVERKEEIKHTKTESREDREDTELLEDDVANHFQAQLTFSHCFETPNKYQCITKVNVQGEDKTYTTKYKCCHGSVRASLSSGCAKLKDLKPLLETFENFNGTNLRRLISTVGLSDKLSGENYTVFMPVDSALDDTTDETNEMNKVEAVGRDTGSRGTASELVLNHIVPGIIDLNDYLNEDIIHSENRNGSLRLNFYPTPQAAKLATVNCVKIIKGNNFATNGMVHIVENVIPTPNASLKEMIDEIPQLSFLKKVLRANNMEDLFKEDGHYTIFAPTNEAFDKLDLGTQEKLLNGHSCASTILRHHITSHTVCSAAIVENATVHDLNGDILNMERRDEDEIYIDGEAKLSDDRVATNGVLHFINVVLVPDTALPIEDVLTKNNVSKFQSIIDQANLKAEFDKMENITLLVPFNEAFDEPETAKYLEEIQNDRDKLKDLILYHTIDGQYDSTDLLGVRQLKTKLEGKSLPVKQYSLFGNLFLRALSSPLIQCASLTKFEDKACGSVIHEIDRLLIPPTQTLLELIEGDKRLSTFGSLLEGTELEDNLKDNNQTLTIIVPTNYGIGKHRYDLNKLKQNKTLANMVLRRHIIRRPLCCQELSRGDAYNLDRWSGYSDPYQINANIIKDCDRIATNGILHTTDRFMYTHE